MSIMNSKERKARDRGRLQGYNKAIEDIMRYIDDDLTIEIGMDAYVERDKVCGHLEQMKRKIN